MVFGGISTERIQLNENSFFAGGPYAPPLPKAREALPKIRQLIFAGQYAEAQKLADETFIPKPGGQMAHQPLAELMLHFPGLENAAGYARSLDLAEAVASTSFSTKDFWPPQHLDARGLCLCRGRRDRGAPGQHAAQGPARGAATQRPAPAAGAD